MASRMPSVDTNVLLRSLLDDIPEQTLTARAFLLGHDEISVADLAITEMVFVLEKLLGFDRASICLMIEVLIQNQHLNMNQHLLAEVVPIYLKHKSVSFNDCCLTVYAELNKQTPLYTFDKKLANRLESAELLL